MTGQPLSVTTADGVRLVADSLGDTARPGVLLAHGGGQTRHSWSGAATALAAAGYHVLNLDLRGHGESAWSKASAYAIDDFAADIAQMTAHFAKDFALVGASLGGLASLTAVNRGLRPKALVLVDIVPEPDMDGIARVTDFMTAHQNGFASVEEAAAAVSAYNPHRTRPPRPDGLKRNLRERDGRFYWHWDPGIIALDATLLHGDIARETAESGWDGVVPTLLVRGMSSDIVDDDGIARLRAMLPSLETFDVRAAGHMVAGDDNDNFNAAVTGFLARRLPITSL